MFKYLTFFIISLFMFSSYFTYAVRAQNDKNDSAVGTLLFLTGDTLAFREFEKTDFLIVGFKQNKVTKKWVLKSYPHEDLLYYKMGDEKFYFYKYKPSSGGFLTVKEMEQYVKGKKDALYGYYPKNKLIKSIFFGALLGLFDTSFEFFSRSNGWSINNSFKGILKSNASFLSISTPLILSSVIGKKKFFLLDRSINNESELLKENYNYGYESVKKSKDTKAVARGSILGLSTIIILSLFI